MTKDDCVTLVKRAFSSWNQDPTKDHRLGVYNAWWDLLADLDYEACNAALTDLVIEDSYFPRPGKIRKMVIDRAQPERKLTGIEAWSAWQAYSLAANSGNVGADLHPLVRATVTRIGSSAASMHTNGDRELFISVFDEVRAAHDQGRYAK